MAQRIHIPQQVIPPGSYAHEITAPSRSNSARLMMTRQPPWPVGNVFTYRAYERERHTGEAKLLTFGTLTGGPSTAKDGTPNPPWELILTWAADKDRDLIRFEIDVIQAFTTAVTVEFL